MTRNDLAERLRRLKKTAPEYAQGLGKEQEEKNLLLQGWEEIDRLVWHRTIEYPAPEWEDFSGPVFLPSREQQYRPPSNAHTGYTTENLLFFDTETTGLSGGAGNSIFLVGLGRIRNGRFLVDQYFLEDFPGEPALLHEVVGLYFQNNTLVISYNGRCFDMPLLTTRCVMNRITPPSSANFDLLYPARRLWRGILLSCSLGSLEENILNKPRGEDIPGRDVPARYFSFLRTKDPRLLTLVFSHNLQDIRSLGDLLLHFEYLSVLSSEDIILKSLCDPYGMALLLEEWEAQKAKELLFFAARKGNWRALYYLTKNLKREGRWKEAVELWEEQLEKGSSFAAVEMAKYYEHRLKDYTKALKTLSCISDRKSLSEDKRYRLEKRKARLLRKLKKGKTLSK